MFPKMRRMKSAMNEDETLKLLKRCPEGILGTIGVNGYPHSVPVNYVLYKDKIYIHSAKVGYKLTNIKENPKVSFTVFDSVSIIEERFTTNYKSAIVYGKAEVVPGNVAILMEFIEKYSSKFLKEGTKYVDKKFDTTFLIEITIEHITGKASNK